MLGAPWNTLLTCQNLQRGEWGPACPVPTFQWRPGFLDLLVGNLQLRKESVSRMCWPLNLAGEAQVASGREVLASSHLER